MDRLTPPSMLSAEDLLAGAAATYTVDVPAAVLRPGGDGGPATGGQVTLRPLTVRDVQRVAQAAKEQRLVSGVLMVQQALVAPKLTVEGEDLEGAIRAPLTRACFVLAREFGWTPAECSALTLGQILLYLEMLARQEPAEGGGA